MARRLGERTELRWGLMPGSYQVTAPTAVEDVWAILRSSRQIITKAFSASYTDGQTRTEMARVHHRSYTGKQGNRVSRHEGLRHRRSAAQGTIRSDPVVGLPVPLRQHPRLQQRVEDLPLQQLVPFLRPKTNISLGPVWGGNVSQFKLRQFLTEPLFLFGMTLTLAVRVLLRGLCPLGLRTSILPRGKVTVP